MKCYQSNSGIVYNADNMEVLRSLEDNSIDAVVTDPPYGISFMGKKWDYDVPSIELWKEVLRVLKPGGHILVACGTRTQHRMVVNIEDAGFEIRDVISWVYGSGFPKSLNIGKAIDKIQGNERELVKIDRFRDGYQRDENNVFTSKFFDKAQHTNHVSRGTSEYEGWGTALKPACEFFTLARKPISETNIAENVLRWGTGGINIDECRIGTDGARNNGSNPDKDGYSKNDIYGKYKATEKVIYNIGRFPANFVHDGSDEVLNCFPETSAPGGYPKGTFEKDSNCYGKFNGITREERFTFDNGGPASRFFYCAKASPSERNEGLDGLELKAVAYGNQATAELNRGNTELKRTGQNLNEIQQKQNHHPTVKPIALMEYLIRLITPKGGIVLDPFAGSGTTGIAAINLKVNYILIEREADYIPIINNRLQHWQNKKDHEPGDLFEEVI